MKIPGVNSAYSKVSKSIAAYKSVKKQAKLNKLVDIESVTPEIRGYLQPVQEMLANYAKANNVRLTIETPSPEFDAMCITVQNKVKGLKSSMIDGNPKASQYVERSRKRMLEDSDGCNYIANGFELHQDNLLRRIYRTVEILTHALNKWA